jgi:hypothetical protein
MRSHGPAVHPWDPARGDLAESVPDDHSVDRDLVHGHALLASLGLEGEEFARGYIQNWLGGASIPEKSAQKIFATAAAILKGGQEKLQQKGEEDTAT